MAGKKTHFLAIPLPLQGHMNPMMQLCKRLAAGTAAAASRNNVMVTLLTTSSANIFVQQQQPDSSIAIKYITDEEVDTESGDVIHQFLARFRAAVSKNLGNVVSELSGEDSGSGHPVNVVILYDSFIPWMLELVIDLGLKGAAFFTQSCAVCAVYNHIQRGTLKIPVEKSEVVRLPSMPVLEWSDLPSSVFDPVAYPNMLELNLAQNVLLEKADWVLFNSFDKLEDEVVSWLVEKYRIKTVGPSTPSMYTDKRLEYDKDYSLNLFKPSTEACMKWLDSKEKSSVVYVSFGSISDLGKDQMEELAWGLVTTKCYFLWVVRSSETNKISDDLLLEVQERGLIVNWCPQLEVLAHEAVGCFMTHCGWNSTIEALSIGVPMVAMPMWIDQTMNSKFIVDVWRVGKRVRVGEKSVVEREEVERVVREVMYGKESKEMKSNALKWKGLAKEAIDEGGSSDKHMEEFIDEASRL